MSEISTRVWLSDDLWQKVRKLAIARKTTVREEIPRLIGQALSESPSEPGLPAKAPSIGTSPTVPKQTESGLPIIELHEVYRCAVCGADVKVGGLTMHMGKHMKELRAREAERSE
ncbi:MAG: hypothetical protein M1319_06400 [Chloroflexi bacterium]|nr:hypothetical protein [Chloroflexota bacterium]